VAKVGASNQDRTISLKAAVRSFINKQKAQRWSRGTLSLPSVLDGGRWSRPHPGRFNPENDRVPHFVGS
jgi:hypothetical protein